MTAFARLSLANRSLVILVAVVISVFGVVTIPSLKQQLLPSLSFPGAFVIAPYPGAAPGIVEEQLTRPIESGFQGIAGVTEVSSVSREGMAQIQVSFAYGTDVQEAVGRLQQALARLGPRLPDGVEPTVVAGNTDDIPVMVLAVGDGGDPQAMLGKLERIAVPELSGLTGVREVAVTGAREQTVVITPDLGKMARLGLSPAAIPELLRANGTPIPAGSLVEDGRSLTVQIGRRISSVEDLRDLYLAPQAPAARAPAPPRAWPGPGTLPAPVRLGDVAAIEQRPAEATTITRTNGTPSLGLSITMTPDGNAVRISHEVRGKLPGLTRSLGDASEITVVFDQAPYVERSIEDLSTEGLLGLAFAVLVILLFLLSLRSTIVTAVSIPLSVVIALIALWAGDHSLNLLTLGALTIAIGRVVDDSIVVLENIKRHLGYGEDKRTAVLTAVREVSGAVTASTLTTVAVFLPIAFVGGMVGELFAPFAITVTVALLASLLVALTVIPVLAYWFLKAPHLPPGQAREVREHAEAKELRSPLQRAYLPVLRFAARRRLVTVLIGFAVLAGTLALTPGLKTNFIDSSGNDTISITQKLPAGTALTATDAAAKKVERLLASTTGVASYQVNVGSGGTFSGGVGGAADRASFSVTVAGGVDTPALEQRLRDAVAGLREVGEVRVGGQQGGGFSSDRAEVILQGPDLPALTAGAQAVTTAMKGIGGLRDVSSNLEAGAPRIEVTVDREKAAAKGLTEAGIGQVVAQAFRGAPIGQVTLDGRAGDIVLRAGGRVPADLAAVRSLRMPAAGGLVKLSSVAEVRRVAGPTQITRKDGSRTASVSAAAEPGDLGAVTAKITERMESLRLPAGVRYSIGGVSADQSKAFSELGLAMLAAIAIVFMIMVATFRSFVQPLILLVSIPFAATGAIGLLRITDTPLGVPALIGMLMLIGIVVTNAIVLIDLVNQYRAQGMDVTEAVVEGGRRRLRPILMTAIATICALTPMAAGLTGSGGFISQPLAVVVIGGLVSSTLLTLVLVPALYTIVERTRLRLSRRDRDGGGRPQPEARDQRVPAGR